MGLFSSIKSGLKKVGGVAKKAAPFVGLIPGVGTLAGGAIGGLGALAAGDGLKGILKSGAMGAASGYAGGGKGIAGLLGGGLKKVGGSAVGKVIGMGPSGMPIFAPSGGSSGLLGKLGGLLGGGLKQIGGIGGLADAGIGAASVAGGVAASRKAEDYRNKALGLTEGSWNDRAGLRKLAIAGLENNTPQDLSSIFMNRSNPFARRAA